MNGSSSKDQQFFVSWMFEHMSLNSATVTHSALFVVSKVLGITFFCFSFGDGTVSTTSVDGALWCFWLGCSCFARSWLWIKCSQSRNNVCEVKFLAASELSERFQEGSAPLPNMHDVTSPTLSALCGNAALSCRVNKSGKNIICRVRSVIQIRFKEWIHPRAMFHSSVTF